jgi:hypothetical protein
MGLTSSVPVNKQPQKYTSEQIKNHINEVFKLNVRDSSPMGTLNWTESTIGTTTNNEMQTGGRFIAKQQRYLNYDISNLSVGTLSATSELVTKQQGGCGCDNDKNVNLSSTSAQPIDYSILKGGKPKARQMRNEYATEGESTSSASESSTESDESHDTGREHSSETKTESESESTATPKHNERKKKQHKKEKSSSEDEDDTDTDEFDIDDEDVDDEDEDLDEFDDDVVDEEDIESELERLRLKKHKDSSDSNSDTHQQKKQKAKPKHDSESSQSGGKVSNAKKGSKKNSKKVSKKGQLNVVPFYSTETASDFFAHVRSKNRFK